MNGRKEEGYFSSCGSNLSTSRGAKQSFVHANGLKTATSVNVFKSMIMSVGPSQRLNKLR